MSEIINAYSIKLVNSLILALISLGSYSFFKFFFTRHSKSKKSRSQYIIRLKYLFFILFMIFFVKIWVEGFTQILAFIGFLSAAITLTQKDNLLNLVGWLIINWRGLFSEEDYIKISNYAGSVKSIGFLYFSLVEINPEFPHISTGRIIKIPNGLVSRNPVTNYSSEKFVECSITFIFKPKGDFAAIDRLFTKLKEEVSHYAHDHTSLNRMEDLSVSSDYQPTYSIKIRHEKPAGYEMLFLFYCRYLDKTLLLNKLNQLVVNFSTEHSELTLAFD